MTKLEKNALLNVYSALDYFQKNQENFYPEVFRFKNDPDFPFEGEFSLEQYHAFRVGMYLGSRHASELLENYFFFNKSLGLSF